MDEDEVLSKITKLLEQGCTMLATHHDCGAPLFRCQGEVVCPVCSFVDEPKSPEKLQPTGSSEEKREERPNLGRAPLQKNGKNSDEELSSAIDDLRVALLAKLRELTAAVQDEHDLHMLKRQLDCLEGLLRTLRSL